MEERFRRFSVFDYGVESLVAAKQGWNDWRRNVQGKGEGGTNGRLSHVSMPSGATERSPRREALRDDFRMSGKLTCLLSGVRECNICSSAEEHRHGME